jgi:uncharacterized Zn-binding protein involved in type VI secretion
MTPDPDADDDRNRTTTADETESEPDGDEPHVPGPLETVLTRRPPLGSHWRRTDTLLEPSDDEVDGIAVGEVESSDEETLRLESGGDLVLSISGGAGAVRIETATGHRVVLDDADGAGSISIADGGGNHVEMDATTGEVSISAAEQITLEAPRVDVTAAEDVTLESGGSTNIDSEGITTLRTAGVMQLQAALLKLNGGGAPAARVGDAVAEGNIAVGSPTVLIG